MVCVCFGLIELIRATLLYSSISRREAVEQIARLFFEDGSRHSSPWHLYALALFFAGYSAIIIYTGCHSLYKKSIPHWALVLCLVASTIKASLHIQNTAIIFALGFPIIALVLTTILMIRLNLFWALGACLVACSFRAFATYNNMSFDVSFGYLFVSLIFAAILRVEYKLKCEAQLELNASFGSAAEQPLRNRIRTTASMNILGSNHRRSGNRMDSRKYQKHKYAWACLIHVLPRIHPQSNRAPKVTAF